MKTPILAFLSVMSCLALHDDIAAQFERSGILDGLTTQVRSRSRLRPSIVAVRYKEEWLRYGGTLAGAGVSNYDFYSSTQDTFFLHAYLETAPASNYPSMTPVRSVGPLPIVNTPVSVSFPGLSLPRDGRDLFLAVELTTTATNGDGGYTFLTSYNEPTSGDMPGPRLPTFLPLSDALLYIKTPTSWSRESYAYHLWVEPLFDPREAIAGAAVAKTNQSTQPGRNNDQTIAGLLSGMHPDPFGMRTSTRKDSFGFRAESSAIQNGDIVVFLLSPQFGPGLKLPGILGRFELDPSAMFVVGAKVASQVTTASYGATLLLSPPATPVTNVDLYWQAMILRAPSTIVGFTHASVQRL
ncbi:MAG: hypothetical protein KDC95_03600 [Planctomycetes bacterium]|nr:hypothetical protein [Planctomycetota bacterium]